MANGIAADVKRAAGWSIALSVLMIARASRRLALQWLRDRRTPVGAVALSGPTRVRVAAMAARRRLGDPPRHRHGGIGFYLLTHPSSARRR
jgi:hypothetical protein